MPWRQPRCEAGGDDCESTAGLPEEKPEEFGATGAADLVGRRSDQRALAERSQESAELTEVGSEERVLAEEAHCQGPDESEEVEACAPRPGHVSSRGRARRAGGPPLEARMRTAETQPLALRACALLAVCHAEGGVPIDQVYAALQDLCRSCSLALTGEGLHHAYREHVASFFAYLMEVDYETFCEATEITPTECATLRRDQCLHELARALQAGKLYENDPPW